MEWLTGNSFFLLILLVCAGMHLFGHGHSHGGNHDKRQDHDHDAHAEHKLDRRNI